MINFLYNKILEGKYYFLKKSKGNITKWFLYDFQKNEDNNLLLINCKNFNSTNLRITSISKKEILDNLSFFPKDNNHLYIEEIFFINKLEKFLDNYKIEYELNDYQKNIDLFRNILKFYIENKETYFNNNKNFNLFNNKEFLSFIFANYYEIIGSKHRETLSFLLFNNKENNIIQKEYISFISKKIIPAMNFTDWFHNDILSLQLNNDLINDLKSNLIKDKKTDIEEYQLFKIKINNLNKIFSKYNFNNENIFHKYYSVSNSDLLVNKVIDLIEKKLKIKIKDIKILQEYSYFELILSKNNNQNTDYFINIINKINDFILADNVYDKNNINLTEHFILFLDKLKLEVDLSDNTKKENNNNKFKI